MASSVRTATTSSSSSVQRASARPPSSRRRESSTARGAGRLPSHRSPPRQADWRRDFQPGAARLLRGISAPVVKTLAHGDFSGDSQTPRRDTRPDRRASASTRRRSSAEARFCAQAELSPMWGKCGGRVRSLDVVAADRGLNEAYSLSGLGVSDELGVALWTGAEHHLSERCSAALPGGPVDVDPGHWEDPLPGPLAAGVGVLAGQGPWQLDPGAALGSGPAGQETGQDPPPPRKLTAWIRRLTVVAQLHHDVDTL